MDKVSIAIERLKMFEPPEGYYLAFSGGKDSQTIYHLAQEAGVKFDAHYNVTTVDPPEVVYFIRENYPDVIFERPELTMWQLIAKNTMPPTRLARYCCAYLKERGGDGRFCITGVRWEESPRRRNVRAAIEILSVGREKILLNDNDEARRMLEICQLRGKQFINPIVDWSEQDVWSYLNYRNIKHCSLYDEGFKRIGCIGCPMISKNNRIKEFKRWPKFYKGYLKAFEKMLENRKAKGKYQGPKYWQSPEEVMNWWIFGDEGGEMP